MMLETKLRRHLNWPSPSRTFALLALVLCYSFPVFSQLTAQLEITDARCFGLRGKVHVASVAGGQAPYYYSLDGSNYSTNPSLAQLQPGDYTLLIRDDFGNHGNLAFTIAQPEHLKAEIVTTKTEVAPNEEFEIGVQISPTDAGIASITWRPDQFFSDNRTDTYQISILQTTTFAVEVRDSANCVAYAQKEVRIHNSDIYFPNVISPRSSGNEVFTLYGGSKVRLIKEMTIVDRYGAIMFRKSNLIPNDTNAGWNGRSKNRTVLPGVYFYQCTLEMEDGRIETISGDISVIN